MIVHPFSALIPNDQMSYGMDYFLDIVSEQFLELKTEGCFEALDEASFYIYRIEDKITITGLVVALDISEIDQGNILGHEQTLIAKETEMQQLINTRRAMIKPVLMGISSPQTLTQWMDLTTSKHKPTYSTQIHHTTYSLWQIKNQEDIVWIQNIIGTQVSKAYIADGHHRVGLSHYMYKQGRAADGMLTMLTDINALGVYAYHRIVQLPVSLTEDLFINRLSAYVTLTTIDPCRFPTDKHDFVIYSRRQSWVCTWLPEILDRHTSDLVVLDVILVNTYLLGEILDVKDIKSSPLLSYVGGDVSLDDIIDKVNLIPGQIGILLFPIDINDIINVADHHQILPPKSTWFEPRVKNGIISLPLTN
jgi:uncharacterized protein (DUF1015 family)